MIEAENDHEVGMAQGQLDYIIKSATELKGKIGNSEKNIPGWIQDHISKAHSYIHQSNSGYHEYGNGVNEGIIQNREKELKMLPKGAKVSGGGYGPFIKIGVNTFKNKKNDQLYHSFALASYIGTFKDFKIDENMEKFRKEIMKNINEGDINESKSLPELMKDASKIKQELSLVQKQYSLNKSESNKAKVEAKKGQLERVANAIRDARANEGNVNESKISQPELKGVYDKLSKGDELSITYDSSMSRNTTKRFKVVKGKTIVGKSGVERITLVNVDNPKAIKYYLYNRNNHISFATGDMGAVITTIQKESMNEQKIHLPNSIVDQIKQSIKMGYNIPKVGMISPNKKGVVLMNKNYEVRGTYPLEAKDAIEQIIKQSNESMNENKRPQEYDTVVYYVEYRGQKYPYYISYIDATHVAIGMDKPKPNSTSGMGVWHIGQLRDKSYYEPMVKWMRTGDRSGIEKKVFQESVETTEPKIITQLRDVVKNGYKKLKDPKSGKVMTVDSYSASAITKVYDALNDVNKQKFSTLGLLGMQSVAFKVLK